MWHHRASVDARTFYCFALQVSNDNDGGWEAQADASITAPDDQSGIFEESLSSAATIGDIDSSTLEFDRQRANKASVIRIIFGGGTTKASAP